MHRTTRRSSLPSLRDSGSIGDACPSPPRRAGLSSSVPHGTGGLGVRRVPSCPPPLVRAVPYSANLGFAVECDGVPHPCRTATEPALSRSRQSGATQTGTSIEPEPTTTPVPPRGTTELSPAFQSLLRNRRADGLVPGGLEFLTTSDRDLLCVLSCPAARAAFSWPGRVARPRLPAPSAYVSGCRPSSPG